MSRIPARLSPSVPPQRGSGLTVGVFAALVAAGCAPRTDAQRTSPAPPVRDDLAGSRPREGARPHEEDGPGSGTLGQGRGPEQTAGEGDTHRTPAQDQLPPQDGGPFEPTYGTTTGPVLSPELLRLRAAAQARILGRGAEIEDAEGKLGEPKAPDSERENGNGLGHFVRIENEAALEAFHAALAQLERGTLPGGKLRILAYGASHTQADIYPGYLRHYLQSRFGDAGPGFMQVAPLDKWHRLLAADLSSYRFSIHHAQRRPATASGWFGLGGAVGIASARKAFASLELRHGPPSDGVATEIDVYAMGHPGGGELRVLVDDQERATWSTHAEPPRPLVQRIVEEKAPEKITVEVAGTGVVRLLGASVEWDRPGIVVDTLGISGTRAANWLAWDEAAWSEQVQRRHPALVLLAYGTNESSDEHQPIEHYERDLGEVLERLQRAAPQASCLLVGPGDASKKVRGKWVERKRLGPIIEVQRRQAHEHGCGFWDARAFMGEGGIARWASAMPAMASADLIHLTPRGYVKLGMALGDALLRAYDAPRHPAPPVPATTSAAPANAAAPPTRSTPAGATPTEAKPTESTPADAAAPPTQPTPAESAPAESAPAESTPAEPKPLPESPPAEPTPAESTPAESTPTEPRTTAP